MDASGRIRGQEKHATIQAVARSLKSHGLPPMDERLKSIVAAQIGSLRKGGWPLEEIGRAAIDLALAWDETRGHNRLTHLQARVRLLDADREYRQHAARKAADRDWFMRAGRNTALIYGRPAPSTHDYIAGQHQQCAICDGPLGVHVRPRVDTEA